MVANFIYIYIYIYYSIHILQSLHLYECMYVQGDPPQKNNPEPVNFFITPTKIKQNNSNCVQNVFTLVDQDMLVNTIIFTQPLRSSRIWHKVTF